MLCYRTAKNDEAIDLVLIFQLLFPFLAYLKEHKYLIYVFSEVEHPQILA